MPHSKTPTPPWLAQGTPILLTPEMREAAYASRRFPKPVQPLTPEDAWKHVHAARFDCFISDDRSDEPLRAAAKRLMARWQSENLPVGADELTDTLVLGLGLGLVLGLSIEVSPMLGEHPLGAAMVDYLVARCGLVQAVSIWLAAQRLQVAKEWSHGDRMYHYHFSTTVINPLLRHLVQRLVWGAYTLDAGSTDGGELRACFRVSEDGSLTTAQDGPFELPAGEGIHIGIPHALELPSADAAAFGQLFADYELLPPFIQIGRDTYTLTAAEKTASVLERWEGSNVPTGRVLGLVNKGWRRGDVEDAGCIWYFLKPLGTGKLIQLDFAPGLFVGMVTEEPEQTLGGITVSFRDQRGNWQDAVPFSTLDPIEASELIRDMQVLCA